MQLAFFNSNKKQTPPARLALVGKATRMDVSFSIGYPSSQSQGRPSTCPRVTVAFAYSTQSATEVYT